MICAVAPVREGNSLICISQELLQNNCTLRARIEVPPHGCSLLPTLPLVQAVSRQSLCLRRVVHWRYLPPFGKQEPQSLHMRLAKLHTHALSPQQIIARMAKKGPHCDLLVHSLCPKIGPKRPFFCVFFAKPLVEPTNKQLKYLTVPPGHHLPHRHRGWPAIKKTGESILDHRA